MKARKLGLLALALATVATSASAHHAFNMYDNSQYTKLQGVVKSFTWHNPHAMIDFVATLPDGSEQVWSVECSAPNIIGRRGWSATSLKAGDKVPLTLHPMKDGTKYGLMVSVTLPDGKILKDKA